MKNFIDYEKLQKLSEADKDVPLYKKVMKLHEEAGEVAQEFLAWDDKITGVKTNSSKSAQGTLEAVIEEVCDATNVCIDILNAIEMKYPERAEYITRIFQEKLDKWESKIQPKLDSIEFWKLYNKVNGEKNEKVIMEKLNNIIDKDMKSIGCIEVMNGNINFK